MSTKSEISPAIEYGEKPKKGDLVVGNHSNNIYLIITDPNPFDAIVLHQGERGTSQVGDTNKLHTDQVTKYYGSVTLTTE